MDRHANRFCGDGEDRDRVQYIRLEDIAGIPTTEVGVGDREKLVEVGLEYEVSLGDDSPYILIQLSAVDSNLSAVGKVYAPADHEYVTSDWMNYVNEIQAYLIGCMKQQQPDAEINGLVTLVNSQDNAILGRVKVGAPREEVAEYEVYAGKN